MIKTKLVATGGSLKTVEYTPTEEQLKPAPPIEKRLTLQQQIFSIVEKLEGIESTDYIKLVEMYEKENPAKN